eukprot:TRINITY_DN14950_c0_g1_i1.p1 TRINITY_DN14950_c0_g1~~TRINITY_DN14950_c0_g1_i1.p1  ORF type:complete len:403 (+),score=62.32 TRINITY_DN14950_c0_g1_i1:47-1255(+)
MVWPNEQPPSYAEAQQQQQQQQQTPVTAPPPPPVGMLSAPRPSKTIDFDAWGAGEEDADETKAKKIIKRDPDDVLDDSSTENSDDDVAAVPMQRLNVRPGKELLKESGSLCDLMGPSIPSSIPSTGFGNYTAPATIKVEGAKQGAVPAMPTNIPPYYNRPVKNNRDGGNSYLSASLSAPVAPMKVEGGLPKAIVTNTSTGIVKVPPYVRKTERERKKRKRRVEVPEVNLNDISSFNVVPPSQKFRKFLERRIKNGCNAFTKGDAEQVRKYASRHSEDYFALKDGWTRTLKGLQEPAEILKAWYIYDCMLNMDTFKAPEIRATWEIRLPDLVATFMDFDNEKYKKLLATWRGRLDPDTMRTIRKKLQTRGVTLADNLVPNKEPTQNHILNIDPLISEPGLLQP